MAQRKEKQTVQEYMGCIRMDQGSLNKLPTQDRAQLHFCTPVASSSLTGHLIQASELQLVTFSETGLVQI
jgi:hypothetical protein